MILILTEHTLEPAINKYLNDVTRIVEAALTAIHRNERAVR